MSDMSLHVRDDLTRVRLIPAAIKILGYRPKLDDKVARKILSLGLAPFLPPQSHQRRLIVPHDDPRIRAAEEKTAIQCINPTFCDSMGHTLLLLFAVPEAHVTRAQYHACDK